VDGSDFGSNKRKEITVCFKGKEVKLSLCLTDHALSHEGVWGSGRIDLHLHLDSS
jgi:hypothetical protein